MAKQRIDATLTADFPLIGLHHFMTMEDTLDLGAALTLNAATRPAPRSAGVRRKARFAAG